MNFNVLSNNHACNKKSVSIKWNKGYSDKINISMFTRNMLLHIPVKNTFIQLYILWDHMSIFLSWNKILLKTAYVLKKTERFVHTSYKTVLSQTDNKDIHKKIFPVNLKIRDIFWNLSAVENPSQKCGSTNEERDKTRTRLLMRLSWWLQQM